MTDLQVHLVAIAKDEARYMREWLAYHLSLGVDRIFVYDNDSTDGTTAILLAAERVYPVAVKLWPTIEGKSPQYTAYADHLSTHRSPRVLTGFIDIDEFIMSRNGRNPIDALRALGGDPSVGAICINQRVFGDAGLADYSHEPVLKRLTRCSAPEDPGHNWVKSFYRLSAVETVGIHSSPLKSGRHVHANGEDVVFIHQEPQYSVTRNIDYSVMQLNHYFFKTLGEFREKIRRGRASVSSAAERFNRHKEEEFAPAQPLRNAVVCEHTRLAAQGIEAIIADFDAQIGA